MTMASHGRRPSRARAAAGGTELSRPDNLNTPAEKLAWQINHVLSSLRVADLEHQYLDRQRVATPFSAIEAKAQRCGYKGPKAFAHDLRQLWGPLLQRAKTEPQLTSTQDYRAARALKRVAETVWVKTMELLGKKPTAGKKRSPPSKASQSAHARAAKRPRLASPPPQPRAVLAPPPPPASAPASGGGDGAAALRRRMQRVLAAAKRVDKKHAPPATPGVGWFSAPVSTSEVGYHQVIKHPMDLATLSARVDQGVYTTFGAFYDDLSLVWKNALQYNGQRGLIPTAAKALRDACAKAAKASKPAAASRPAPPPGFAPPRLGITTAADVQAAVAVLVLFDGVLGWLFYYRIQDQPGLKHQPVALEMLEQEAAAGTLRPAQLKTKLTWMVENAEYFYRACVARACGCGGVAVWRCAPVCKWLTVQPCSQRRWSAGRCKADAGCRRAGGEGFTSPRPRAAGPVQRPRGHA